LKLTFVSATFGVYTGVILVVATDSGLGDILGKLKFFTFSTVIGDRSSIVLLELALLSTGICAILVYDGVIDGFAPAFTGL
jgi:hypothetical protein